MNSILSQGACQLISDGCIRRSENPPTFRANSSQCVSVTGQPLLSSSLIVAHVVFPRSNYMYERGLLICDNVLQPLQCILGWDFIVFHHLQWYILGDNYVLVGPHGSTPLTPLPPSATPSSSPIISEVHLYFPSYINGDQLRLLSKVVLHSLYARNVPCRVRYPIVMVISLVWLVHKVRSPNT